MQAVSPCYVARPLSAGSQKVAELDALQTKAHAAYGPITIAIRARFDYDSSTIQHPTRSYVLSSNNEHVNSFAML